MVEWLHPMFLKTNSEYSKKDNPNWCEDISGSFSDQYYNSDCTEIETLDHIEAWGVV